MARHNRATRGPRPNYAWTTFGDAFAAAAFPAKTMGATTLQASLPQTLRRIRGHWGVTLDTGGVDEVLIVRAGIIIVSEDAAAIGVTAVPGPGSDRSQPWIWTGQLYLSSGAEAAVVNDQLSQSGMIDSKAMRRMKPGDNLAFVVEVLAAELIDQGGSIDFVYAIDSLATT